MKKREQGVLTIEASIVLTTFILLVLFLFSFTRLYRAQNVISHAVLQSTDALALESYLRETAHDEDAEDVVKLGNQLLGFTSFSEESFASLRAADIPKLAKEKFVAGIASSEANADAKLKQLGIKDGLSGLDFSQSKMDLSNNDVIVHVSYTLELQFPVFGFDEINATKVGKAKTFGDILFEIRTISNDDRKGTASGGGSYKHGEKIEITAEPKYGYYFDGWDDNGDGIVDYDAGDPTTISKRVVTVLDAKTYTAIFKNSGYGVNASVSPSGIEEISIAPTADDKGLYEYGSRVELTVSNTNPHYNFIGWTGQLLQDKNGDGYEETIVPIPNPRGELKYTIPEVRGNYHLIANFVPKQYNISVAVKDNVGGSAFFEGTTKTFDMVTYQDVVSFTATPAYGYVVDYWMKGDSIIQSSYGQTTISSGQVTEDASYTVVFKNIRVTVSFLGPYNSVIETYTLNKGQSFSTSGLNVPAYTVVNDKIFCGWKNFSSTTPVNSNITVEGNWGSPAISINNGAQTNVQTTYLSVTKFPQSGTVTWKTSNSSKATVNSSGVVSAVGSGKVVITATLNYYGLQCSDSVTIEIGVDKIKLEEYNYMTTGGVRHYFDREVMPGSRLPGSNKRIYYDGWAEGGALIGSDEYKEVTYSDEYFYYRYIWVTEEQLKSAVIVRPGGYSPKGQNQWGYNKTNKTGYIFNPYYDQYGFIFFKTNEKTYKITSIV